MQALPSQVSGDVHNATDAEHLQALLLESQYAPCAFPVQELAVPHLHALFPESQVSPVLHAVFVAEHLHTLLVASQYAPVVRPLHEEPVPHIHDPPEQVSSETLQVMELHASTTADVEAPDVDPPPSKLEYIDNQSCYK